MAKTKNRLGLSTPQYDKLPEADSIYIPDHDSIDGSNVFQEELPVINQTELLDGIGLGDEAHAQSALELDIKKAIADLKTLVSLEDVFENLDTFWEEEIL